MVVVLHELTQNLEVSLTVGLPSVQVCFNEVAMQVGLMREGSGSKCRCQTMRDLGNCNIDCVTNP